MTAGSPKQNTSIDSEELLPTEGGAAPAQVDEAKKPPVKRRRVGKAAKDAKVTKTKSANTPFAGSTVPSLGAQTGAPSEEELDADEAEFRAMRRDMDGVKDTAVIGIVTINVAKGPPKNEFFRTHAAFYPTVPIVNVEKGMERHFFAVAPDMIAPLLEIGISVADHILYLTVASGGAVTVVPVRQALGDGEQNEYDRTKEIGLRQARTAWVRLFTDQANRCYKVFPAVEGRFTEPTWPDISPAKIFRLSFRDKGRLIDNVDHPLFQKWASRDRDVK